MVIPTHGLRQLKAYKYSASGSTPLETHVFNPFWNAAVHALPRWLAPNLVTLLGFASLVISFTLVMRHDPTLMTDVPAWMPLVHASAVFFYQTMDALDGKQARRTGSSSPMGQLFDHGCDATATILFTIPVVSNMGMGLGMRGIWLFMLQAFPFFLGMWEEHHFHVFRSNIGYMGVTEGIVAVIAGHLATAVWGTGMWQASVATIGGIELVGGDVLLIFYTLTVAVGTSSYLSNVLFGSLPGPQRTLAAFQLTPILIVLGSAVWVMKSGGPLADTHSLLVIVLMGVCCIHLCNQMIVASMCRVPFPVATQHVTLLLPIVMAVEYVWGGTVPVDLGPLGSGQVDTEGALVACLCVAVVAYGWYAVRVMREISSYLGIPIFVMPAHANKEA
jgi:ethanolaminephosphotransferase